MKAEILLPEDVQEILKRLGKIEAEVHQLHRRINRLEAMNAMSINLPITTKDLLKLPDTLRKTMLVIAQLDKESSAEAVAKQTHRTRGMESIYLNQLTRMGYLEKSKRGKRTYFRPLRITKSKKNLNSTSR